MSHFYGKYRGQVVAVDDPDGEGRASFIVPAVHGKTPLPSLAFPNLEFGGPGHGDWAPPQVGEWRYIEFEGGDIHYPIYGGGWWGKGEMPDDFKDGKTYGTITPKGGKILIREIGETVEILIDAPGALVKIQGADGSPIARQGDTTTHQCPVVGAFIAGTIDGGSAKATCG